MVTKKKIRILLAEDHNLVREGFRRILEMQPDLEVLDEVSNGREAVESIEHARPDVVLMDISMPELNGIEATRIITSKRRPPRVICLSMHKERRMIGAILKAGASGYLLKNCRSQELIEAVRTVASGKTFISSSVAGEVVEAFVRSDSEPNDSAFEKLTPREREVLQLIAEGITTKEIGGRLDISHKTVLVHRLHLSDKLGLKTDVELARYALQNRLAEL